MPQPYRKRGGHVHFHPDSLKERPELGLLIGCIAAEAARMDLHLIRIAGALARHLVWTDGFSKEHIEMSDRVVEMIAKSFLSLSGSTARNSMLDALAKDALTPDKLTRFNEMKKRLRAINKQRNRIVHGIWGFDAALPDALILQEVGDAMRYGIGEEPRELICYIYKEPDFNQLIYEIQMMNGSLAFFKPRDARKSN
jgi:hypothetical protein